jgi:hypothetical protein
MNEEVKAAKLYAIEYAMNIIKDLKAIFKKLEHDLKDESNEKNQQEAALAIRTFHEFIVRDTGFSTWQEKIADMLFKEMKRRGLH